jgi:hypothetical protein
MSPDGRLGVVDHLLFDDPDEDAAPAVIAVRTGLFARHELLVAATDVTGVDPRRRRLSIRGGRHAAEADGGG